MNPSLLSDRSKNCIPYSQHNRVAEIEVACAERMQGEQAFRKRSLKKGTKLTGVAIYVVLWFIHKFENFARHLDLLDPFGI